MKKTILLLASTALFAFASVNHTTVGCIDKSALKNFVKLAQTNKLTTIDQFYKYAIENDCEIIEKGDTIKLLGKPYSDGTMLVFVKKYDKDLYIQSKTVTNKFTKDNHYLNKSF